MNRAALIPPLAPEDRLPHDAAVWRDYQGCGQKAAHGTQDLAISVDYGGGLIEQGISPHDFDWSRVKRWRFGWALA